MSKTSIIFSSLVMGVLLIGAGCGSKNSTNSEPVVTDQLPVVAATDIVATSTTSTPAVVTPAVKPAPAVAKPVVKIVKPMTYSEALAQYDRTGYRFQFVECHGLPGNLVIKKGAKIMLDNRDKKKRTIVVGKQPYVIAGYSFVIMTANVLGTNYITCDGGGAARLEVVK